MMREALDIMAIVGIPSLFTMVVFITKTIYKLSKKISILMDAQQKQMRRELTNDYHEYMDRGSINDDELDLWEAGYQAYHALGENGIMDSRRADLIVLNGKNNGQNR